VSLEARGGGRSDALCSSAYAGANEANAPEGVGWLPGPAGTPEE
jgi:hypothetical protein